MGYTWEEAFGRDMNGILVSFQTFVVPELSQEAGRRAKDLEHRDLFSP